MKKEFFLSTSVDFFDDAGESVYGPQNVDAMMRTFKDMGIRRVYWAHYGDASYDFLWEDGSYVPGNDNRVETIKKLGQPIKIAVEAAKRYGLEIYAFIKPYENGISKVIPGETPELLRKGNPQHLGGSIPCLMRYVKEHPQMRIKRRMDDIPSNIQEIPVDTIKLYKKDAGPTRIKHDNIEIWTSKTNCSYEYKKVNFKYSDEVVPAPRDFIDIAGNILVEKSSPVRVLTLSGLNLEDKYILVTTNFKEEPADFVNSELNMLEVFGPDGMQLPVSIGLEHRIWPIDNFNFRTSGIVFDDGGYGRESIKLDSPNMSGNEGFLAFTRGRNEYLPTALCESYNEVRDFWLTMVQECLDAGVDGVDFRIENHSTHTSDPFSYGFNDVILTEYQKRYGKVIDEKDYDLKLISKVRGDFYTEFLKRARVLIKSYGKSMQVHLNVEFFRPDPPTNRYLAYPWNILFDWQEWIREGILDEATLRTFTFTPEFVLQDIVSNTMIDECCKRNIPIHYLRYARLPYNKFEEEIDRIYMDGRFQSFVIYEAAEFIKSDGKEGVIVIDEDFVNAVRRKAEQLGII